MLGFEYGGECESARLDESCYLIPRDTLCGTDSVPRFQIAGEGDILGGWVPEAYMATKAILHPLVSPEASAPPGWPQKLAAMAEEYVLPGASAFSAADTVAGGQDLLLEGPVRLKPVYGKGGHGQMVVTDIQALPNTVSQLSAVNAPENGFVIEANLSDVDTYTVGQSRLPRCTVSYCGTQFLTEDNTGGPAYGGSELTAVLGGYDNLPADILPEEMLQAVRYAAGFDDLVDEYLPGLIASRRNYDVACGRAHDGALRMGIIDQSRRVGGATGAELVAAEVLVKDPDARAVRARSAEIYGDEQSVPEGALICFQGDDPEVGPLLKCAFVEETIAR
nr:DUF3182 family protein [Chelativorans sp. YIM 93263]